MFVSRRIRGRAARGGFTLIEILVVIVIIGVLATMGVSKYTEFTTESRKNACISNQTGVDKGVGVWESQKIAISKKSDAKITFNGSGDITKTVGTLPKGLSTADDDKRAVAEFIRDDNVFMCPEVASGEGGYSEVKRTQDIYLWVSTSATQTFLNNNRRGVACLQFSYDGSADKDGPDGTSDTRHR